MSSGGRQISKLQAPRIRTVTRTTRIITPSETSTTSSVTRTNIPAAGRTGIPTPGRTSIPTAGRTSIPTAGRTSIPTAGRTSIPTAGRIGIPTAGRTGIPSAGRTNIPSAAGSQIAAPRRENVQTGRFSLDAGSMRLTRPATAITQRTEGGGAGTSRLPITGRTSLGPSSSRGTGLRTVTSSTSTINVNSAGRKTTTTNTTRKTYKVPGKSQLPGLASGRHVLPVEYGPATASGRRPEFPTPEEVQSPLLRKSPRGTAPATTPFRYSPIPSPEGQISSPRRRSFSPAHDVSLNLSPPSDFENEMEQQLVANASRSPDGSARAKGSKTYTDRSPLILQTLHGPVDATHQIILERRTERSPVNEHITRHMTGVRRESDGRATHVELDLQELEPGGLNVSLRGQRVKPLHETVSIKNIMTVAPGICQSTTNVVHETTKDPDAEARGPSPQEVAQMVDEETKDVESMLKVQRVELQVLSPTTYPLKKKLQQFQFNSESVGALEESMTQNPVRQSATDIQDEMQPELIAAIMHTEEQGIRLGSPPTQLCATLFPDKQEDPVIGISSAGPAPFQDVVVPLAGPSKCTGEPVAELQQATASLGLNNADGIRPADNMYSESVAQGGEVRVGNIASKSKRKKKSKPVVPVGEENPPWGEDEDIQPMIDVVGATPYMLTIIGDTSTDGSATNVPQEPTNGLEYMLTPQSPSHGSRVQLRGSQKPVWFPGYFLSLPEVSDCIMLAKSPSTVLAAAWRSVQPKLFLDNVV